MNCPKCEANDVHGFGRDADLLWMDFESDVIDGYLHTVYYCKRCDFNQEKIFDPELIHLNTELGRVVSKEEEEE
jgi:hypothetical protein